MFMLEGKGSRLGRVVFPLLCGAALGALACLLGLAMTPALNSAAARDPFSPACIKYNHEGSRFDERTRLRLYQECARFLAAGIRKGEEAGDWYDVESLRDWAVQGLGVCTRDDRPLACAAKLDAIASLTPPEQRRAPPATRPRREEIPVNRGGGVSKSGDREGEKRDKFKELEEVSLGDEEFTNFLKARWLVSRGNYCGDRGMLDEALQDFEEALQLK